MHLLVLSAFRRVNSSSRTLPSLVSMHLLVLSAFRLERYVSGVPDPQGLNAPSGAQCFPTETVELFIHRLNVSQCTFWCSVLSDLRRRSSSIVFSRSQCTFWCSVLSDSAPRKPRHTAVYRNEIAADLESTTSNRPAPVQLNHTTAKNRHKPPQRRRRALPTSTPPTFNEPKPKNRPLTTTSR